jgi:tryptophan-rich sensory protein
MNWTILLAFLTASVAAGATGSLFKPGEWYETLRKPAWTPPKLAFPVAWTALYLLMAIAAARVAVLSDNGLAVALYAAQIALNTLWTPVFFGARRPGLGLLVIVALLVMVVLTTFAFWSLDWVAGLIMVPYVVWLCLATALNFWIWRNNRPVSP